MRLEVLPGKRTYPLAFSLWTQPVDLWTLCGVTDSLQDGRLAGICSSNNEDPELNLTVFAVSGSSHIVRSIWAQFGFDLTHCLITVARRLNGGRERVVGIAS
jgi:hypothetical protein